jgi:hypothetical protein
MDPSPPTKSSKQKHKKSEKLEKTEKMEKTEDIISAMEPEHENIDVLWIDESVSQQSDQGISMLEMLAHDFFTWSPHCDTHEANSADVSDGERGAVVGKEVTRDVSTAKMEVIGEAERQRDPKRGRERGDKRPNYFARKFSKVTLQKVDNTLDIAKANASEWIANALNNPQSDVEFVVPLVKELRDRKHYLGSRLLRKIDSWGELSNSDFSPSQRTSLLSKLMAESTELVFQTYQVSLSHTHIH